MHDLQMLTSHVQRPLPGCHAVLVGIEASLWADRQMGLLALASTACMVALSQLGPADSVCEYLEPRDANHCVHGYVAAGRAAGRGRCDRQAAVGGATDKASAAAGEEAS